MEKSEENATLENPVVNGGIKLIWITNNSVVLILYCVGLVEKQAAGRSEQAVAVVSSRWPCGYALNLHSQCVDFHGPNVIICSLKY